MTDVWILRKSGTALALAVEDRQPHWADPERALQFARAVDAHHVCQWVHAMRPDLLKQGAYVAPYEVPSIKRRHRAA